MVIVENIAPHHDVNSFTCGTRRIQREMNDFLRFHGSKRQFGTTFVVVPQAGSSEVIAYFTVAPNPATIAATSPDAQLNEPLIHLRYLAVARAYQNQGIGEEILLYLIGKVLAAAQVHPELESLEVSALDETSKGWYLRRNLGFRELAPGSLLLTLPLDEIRLVT